MLSEREKKEMLEDALSAKRRKGFEIADKRAEKICKKHLSSLTPDKVIRFLMDAQKVTGPFPVSKIVPVFLEKPKL